MPLDHLSPKLINISSRWCIRERIWCVDAAKWLKRSTFLIQFEILLSIVLGGFDVQFLEHPVRCTLSFYLILYSDSEVISRTVIPVSLRFFKFIFSWSIWLFFPLLKVVAKPAPVVSAGSIPFWEASSRAAKLWSRIHAPRRYTRVKPVSFLRCSQECKRNISESC